MTRTVIALYDNFQDANMAVRELVDNGFNRDDISLMAGDESGQYSRYIDSDEYRNRSMTEDTTAASSGAGVGASIGATLGGIGGLLVGLGALVIPGIGPVIAAGPLSAALAGLAGAGAGALAGGITGGLIGALVDAGVPEETAQYYSEGVRRGGTLLSVRASDELSGSAVDIMNRHHPVDINSRASQWREQGWTGFHQDTDVTRDQESSGSFTGVVDEHAAHDTERIPNTGEGDTSYGSMGSTYSGDAGLHGSYGEDTSSRRDFQQGSSYGTSRESGRDFDQAGGVMDQRDSMARGENTSTGDISSQNYNTTTGDFTRSESDYRHADSGMQDSGMRGTMDSDFGRGHYRDYSAYDTTFHEHFNTLFGGYGGSYTYDTYQPAYRYGYDMAVDPRYSGRSWQDVEPEAQRYWEDREPGAWERFKDAVQHAWNQVRNQVD